MGYHDCKLTSLISKGLDNSHGISHFLARTASQREAIFKLRYDAYYDQGLIRGNKTGKLFDWQDEESSSSIYGITLRGTLVSTIRLSLVSRKQKACTTYAMFKDDFDPIVDNGEKILDCSRLAVNCKDNALRRSVVLYALSLTMTFAASVGADRGAIVARHSHVPFYRRYGFDLVRGPFSYHEALTPLSFMMVRMPKSAIDRRSETPPMPARTGTGYHRGPASHHA